MIFNMSTGGASTADKVKYNNTESGLQSTDVQGAIDEVNSSLMSKIAFPNYSDKIKEITTAGETWTATQDCCVVGTISQNNSEEGAVVYVNDNKVCAVYTHNTKSSASGAFFFVKKGQVVKTKETYGTYILSVYALDN